MLLIIRAKMKPKTDVFLRGKHRRMFIRKAMGLTVNQPLPCGWFNVGFTVTYTVQQMDGETCVLRVQ